MKRRAKLRLPAWLRRIRGRGSGQARLLASCWCWRCTLDRAGIYRRRRTLHRAGIRIERRCCGILVQREITPLNGSENAAIGHGQGHEEWTTTSRAT